MERQEVRKIISVFEWTRDIENHPPKWLWVWDMIAEYFTEE